MHTRGTFPSHFRIPMMEGINYWYLLTMRGKDGFSRSELLQFSPSSATLQPSSTLPPLTAVAPYPPQSPFLSSPAWGLSQSWILLPLAPIFSTLSPGPLPFLQFDRSKVRADKHGMGMKSHHQVERSRVTQGTASGVGRCTLSYMQKPKGH